MNIEGINLDVGDFLYFRVAQKGVLRGKGRASVLGAEGCMSEPCIGQGNAERGSHAELIPSYIALGFWSPGVYFDLTVGNST